MEPLVDVIIPVYRGAEQTRRCIESVLSHPQRTPHAVIVIDDASPEPFITDYLDQLAATGRIELHRNATNLGFVRTANLGMRLHPERDLVLLNSDTEVANDWLDRLRDCALGGGDTVATVTPFSNNATICSYPEIAVDNPLPAGLSVADLDALFRQQNRGASLELFTGVGFCLYMTRLGLDGLGGFDEHTFGSGYGEEVDYCMRARIAGWRHLLCCDCFVFHQGGVSFQAESEPAKLEAQKVIDHRFADYADLVTSFLERDPPRPFRRAVDLARLLGSSRPRLLFVSHHWGGGVARHVEELALALADVADVLLLQPHGASSACLRWLRADAALTIYQSLEADPAPWLELLGGLKLSRLHYHHVQGFPEWILDLADGLGIDYDVTLHDYTPVCPQHHFVTASGAYCGEPAADVCTACIAERPAPWPLDIRAWRARFLAWLAGAERVIAPSQDVAERIGRYRQGLPLQVWPHLELAVEPYPLAARSLARRRILLLGSLSDAKGLQLVSQAALLASRHQRALDFRVVGSIRSPVPLWPEANLSLTGEYAEDDLPALLEQERPDAFLFASLVPETYSYTLSLAMRTGLPIVALSTGAFVERLRDYPGAVLLPADVSVEALLERLASLPSAYAEASSQGLPLIRPVDSLAHDPAFYVERYLAPVGAGRCVEPPSIASRNYYALREQGESPPLDVLFEHGVLCGMAEARAQLAREAAAIPALQRALAARETKISELTLTLGNFERSHRLHVGHLEQKVSGLEQRIAELEGSTFWRMTAPLRWSVQRGRQAGVALRSAPREMPRMVQQVRRLYASEGVAGLRRAWQQRRRRVRARQCNAALAALYRPETEIGPLNLPCSSEPLITVVIPTFGQHTVTFTCLKSLAEHPPRAAIEVLVIDDCAPEPAAKALGEVQGPRIIRNPHNLGFLRSCNAAVRQARGSYLLLLNNDTIVLPGVIDRLVETFDAQDNVGAVGAKLLYPNGRLQEAGGIVWKDASAWNWGKHEDAEDPRFQYLREVDYCSAACLMLPTALFQELGGFDDRYVPAYYEDTDLCFAIRAQGKRVLYQPAAAVVHFEGVTHGTDERQGLKAYQVRNRLLFQEKWAARLSSHMDNGVCPERVRDRVDGKRILWVEACMLTPDQDSGSLRTWRLLRILCGLGYKVTFMADNLEASQPYTQKLQSMGVEVQYAPYTRAVADYLTRGGTQYDVIVLCRHYIAIKYVDLARRVAPNAQILFDTVDLHYLRLRRQAVLDANANTRKLAEKAYRDELSVAKRADITLVVSDVERHELATELPSARVEVLGNVHDPVTNCPPPEGRSGILFVGGFQHPPNVDAVEYYIYKIWPRFQALQPGVQTYVIGSRMPSSLRRLGEEAGIEMLGYVDDIAPYLQACSVSIAPLRYGAGVKGKVQQAMSYGLPIVATSIAVEGTGLTNGADVLIGDQPEAFVAAMVRLCTDDALWQQLSGASRACVERTVSTAATIRMLKTVLQAM